MDVGYLSGHYSVSLPDLHVTSNPNQGWTDIAFGSLGIAVGVGAAVAVGPEAVGAGAALEIASAIIDTAWGLVRTTLGVFEVSTGSSISAQQMASASTLSSPVADVVFIAERLAGVPEEEALRNIEAAKTINSILDLLDAGTNRTDLLKSASDLLEKTLAPDLGEDRSVGDHGNSPAEATKDDSGAKDNSTSGNSEDPDHED